MIMASYKLMNIVHLILELFMQEYVRYLGNFDSYSFYPSNDANQRIPSDFEFTDISGDDSRTSNK